ncbi:MAG TPA: DCC1-like thiol-disulfide oxidoreductase family protein [Solirubrobacteraceae bacterium]|jgi:predicted DCC family thiol-disulfide oxidoreductase YuxK|nr:DCC1-like thiol-disulfide oxidoreductase family protein [Solirubrobacteraceae bacterium]
MTASDRWIVIYDGECGVCATLLALLLRADRDRRLRPLALGTPESDALLSDLCPAEREASWHLIDPAGHRESAGAAAPPLLRLLPGGDTPAALLARFPRQTERAYRAVADHRTTIGRWLPSSVKRRAKRTVAVRTELATER